MMPFNCCFLYFRVIAVSESKNQIVSTILRVISSGGPLFIETDPNRYEIFGVVSFGDGCARDFPGIYGRIADEYTLKWIKKFIADSDANVCSDTALRLDGKFYADF